MSPFLSALDLITRARAAIGAPDDGTAYDDGFPSPKSPNPRTSFHHDVTALLDTGDDSLLRQALRTLEDWREEPGAAPSPAWHEEAGLLQDTIYEAGDQATADLRVSGSAHLPAGWIVPTLVPITFMAPYAAPNPTTLDTVALQRITAAWHSHPIGRPPHRLLVMPRLYTTKEIPVTWPGRRQWLQQFRAHFSGSINHLLQIAVLAPSPLRPPAALRTLNPDLIFPRNGEQWLFGLRFLVVASFQPDEGLPAFDLDAYMRGNQAIPKLLQSILETMVPPVSVIAVGEPGAWDEALDTAITMHNAEGLSVVFGGDTPARLLVHGHAVGGAVIWDMQAPGPLWHRWIVRDDPIEELGELLRALDCFHTTAIQVELPIHHIADCPWNGATSASA